MTSISPKLNYFLKFLKDNEPEERFAYDPFFAHNYALHTKKRFVLGEPCLSQEPMIAYNYALVIGQRFELGEKAISTNGTYSLFYSRDIVKGRFLLGEKIISDKIITESYVDWMETFLTRDEYVQFKLEF